MRLWNAATGRAVGQPLIRSPAAVSSMTSCAAEIGDCVTAHGDGTVRAWTAATAALCAVPSPPDVSALTTLTCTDHLSLVTGDVQGRVRLANLRTGHQPSPPLRVSNRAVLALCALPGQPPEGRAAAADGSGTITIITISASGQLKAGPAMAGFPGPVRALCPITLPDGRVLLAAAGNDAAIRIWDLTAVDPAEPPASPAASADIPLTGHDGWIWSLAAIPARAGGPPLLASAGADRTIRVWDPATGRPVGQPLRGHTGQIRAVISAAGDDGRVHLVSGGHDGTIRLWDLEAGAVRAVIPLGIPVHALLQQRADPASRRRTDGGATITVGLRTGILSLDVHRDLMTP